MANGFMDRYFNADAVANAMAPRREPAPAPRRGLSDDEAVMKDMGSGRDNLVSRLRGHGLRMTEAEDYYAAGMDDKGDAIVNAEIEFLNANRRNITLLGGRRSDNPEVEDVYATARSVAKQDFMSRKVKRAATGEEYTIGQIHSRRSDAIKQAAVESYGFDGHTGDSYFGRVAAGKADGLSESQAGEMSDMLKASIRVFVDPEMSAKDSNPAASTGLREQRVKAAKWITDNQRRLYDAFGRDGEAFARTVSARSGTAGGMKEAMEGLLSYAEARKESGQAVDARELADGFFDTIAAVNGEAGLSDSLQRNAAMGVLEAVKASGAGIDISLPETRNAIAFGLSVLARGYADGYNLLSMKGKGVNVQKHLGNLIATVNETGQMPQDNPIAYLQTFTDRLNNFVTADGSPAPQPKPTGNPKAYEQPESTGARNVVKGFRSALTREIVPGLFSGRSIETAVSLMSADQTARVRARVAREMGLSANSAFVNAAFNGMRAAAMGGTKFDLQSFAMDRMLKNDPEARAWVNANVLDADRFAEKESEVMEHLVSELVGMKPQAAQARVAGLRIKADRAARAGGDPYRVYDDELRRGAFVRPTGYYLTGKVDRDGNLERREARDGRVPVGAVREYEVGEGDYDGVDMSAVFGENAKPGLWKADRAAFRRLQQQMLQDKKRSDAVVYSWARAAKPEEAEVYTGL